MNSLTRPGHIGRIFTLALERKIMEKTWGRIRPLRVDLETDRIFVRGKCTSYYLKQLVIQALLELDPQIGSFPFAVEIEVSRPGD